MGCNTLAELIQDSETVGICRSLCSYKKTSGCYGFNCSQTAIPPNINSYKVNFFNNFERCRSAFIVRDRWLASSNLDAVLKMDYVPAMLQWGNSQGPCGLSKAFNGTTCTNTNDSMNCWEQRGQQAICICSECKDLAECKNPSSCYLYGMGSQGSSNSIMSYHSPRSIQTDGKNSSSCCTCPDPGKPDPKNYYPIGFGTAAGFVLFIAISGSLYDVMLTKSETLIKKAFFQRNGGLQLSNTKNLVAQIFTCTELEIAADNYQSDTSTTPSSNEDQILHRIMSILRRILLRIMSRILRRILCRRGEGKVSKGKSKGKLKDGRLVTIKKSSIVDEDKVDEYIKEVETISQINHANIVKLIGCCLETKVPFLVYDQFTSNRTLYEYMHTPIKDEELKFTWEIRLRIATEVAGTLCFLHSATPKPIYHRDIKSRNILLDEQYAPKLAGLGTWRSISIEEAHVTTRVLGTFGYIDPEYFQSGQFTEKSDVYSFGVVLVELLTGQKPISASRPAEERSLATSFLRSMEENRLSIILNASVQEEGETVETIKEETIKVAKIAEKCLNLNGKMRPTMSTVAMELEAIRPSQGASSSTIDQQEHCKDDDCTVGDNTGSFDDNEIA